MKFKSLVVPCALLLSFAQPHSTEAQTQTISDFDRQRAQLMLKTVNDEVRKHYYDTKFHGVDLDKEFAEAKQRIEKVNTMNMALANIANFLDSLDDSHTFFLPPPHPIKLDYGWQYQMIGEHCFVTQVRAGSDAAAKGVKPGDEVLSIKQRSVDVAAHIVQTKRVTNLTDGGEIWNVIREIEAYDHYARTRFVDSGDDLIVVRLAQFQYTPREVAELMGRVRKHKALILDLRGNPGGATETVEYLAGDLLSKDVKIADRVGRKEKKPMMTKGSHDAFTGKLFVLVDSQSASASEVLTRLIQIEKRGVVLGDRSSGSVMEAREFSQQVGSDTAIFYGISITDADLIMSDGKSLEHVGVTPDELILPTAADLSANLDPVMARAAELAGVHISAADAGKMFPYEWPPE